MSDFATEWGTTYNKANIAFSKDINAGYNGDRTRGAMLKRLLADAQNTSGVVDALGAKRPKCVKEFEDAAKLKITVKDKHGYELPTEIKAVFPDTYRQLKILQTEIKAIAARAANALEGAINTEKQDKIEAEKNKAKGKVQGSDDAANAKLAQIAGEAAMKTFLLKFAPGFKSSMAKGAAAIQKIKAKPDLATYNLEMNNAGRDISQNLVNIAKLQSDPKFKDQAREGAAQAERAGHGDHAVRQWCQAQPAADGDPGRHQGRARGLHRAVQEDRGGLQRRDLRQGEVARRRRGRRHARSAPARGKRLCRAGFGASIDA